MLAPSTPASPFGQRQRIPVEKSQDKNRRVFGIVSAIAAMLGLIVYVVWIYWPPVQIGVDHQVFDTVDALFTAVTSKNEQRLSDCEKRLVGYRDSGQLPAEAAAKLDSIIAQARSGAWQPAAAKLYDFMRGQRREGAIATHEQNKPDKHKHGKHKHDKHDHHEHNH